MANYQYRGAPAPPGAADRRDAASPGFEERNLVYVREAKARGDALDRPRRGDPIDPEGAIRVLRRCIDLGVNFIDPAVAFA